MENLFSIWKKLVSNSQLEILLVDQKRVVVQKKKKTGILWIRKQYFHSSRLEQKR